MSFNMTRKRISASLNYAVVAGLDLNGLGVVRALTAAGVPVLALDTDFAKPTAATRHGLKWLVRSLSGEAFIEDLLQLRAEFTNSPVLILTEEASVSTVSTHRARINAEYRFTLPPDPVVQDLLDKHRFQDIAERSGFPVPRAVGITKGREPAGLEQLRYPCVVKPATKDPEYGKWFAKAYKVSCPGEVLQLWEKMRAATDRVIVQEWIEGDDSDVYFCLQYRTANGPAASFVGRKLCQWPPQVGGTASCMPAPEFEAALTELTNEFFAAVGFVGMGSIEYKRDRRNGRFYMVEPTVGRTDLQEEVAALNGVNIPLAAWRSELGLAIPAPKPVNPPRIWRDGGGLELARRAGAVVPAISGATVVDALFRKSDPGPFLALKRQSVRSRVSRFARLFGARDQLAAAS